MRRFLALWLFLVLAPGLRGFATGFEQSWQTSIPGDPEQAARLLLSAAWRDAGNDCAFSLPIVGSDIQWDGSRWQLGSARIALGNLVLPWSWSLLQGSLSPLITGAAASSAAGAGMAGNLGSFVPGTSAAPIAMGLRPFAGLDLFIEGGTDAYHLGVMGNLDLPVGPQDHLALTVAWYHGAETRGVFALAEPEMWWLDTGLVKPAMIDHLQILAEGSAAALSWHALAQASLPVGMAAGLLLGGNLDVVFRADPPEGVPSLSAVDDDEAPNDSPAPKVMPRGKLQIGLAARWADANYVDAHGEFLPQPLLARMALDWSPFKPLIWRNRFDLALGRYPWIAAGLPLQRPLEASAAGSLQLADRLVGLRLGWDLGWRGDAYKVWKQLGTLTVRAGLSPGCREQEWRLALDASLGLSDGMPSQLGGLLSVGWRWEKGQSALSARVRAGLKAPLDWWRQPDGDKILAKSCAITAGMGGGLKICSKQSWQLGMNGSFGLEEATAASDWAAWTKLVVCRVDLDFAW